MAEWSLLLSLALLWRICCGVISLAIYTQNETDKLALISFRNAIQKDPIGIFASWNDSNHFCYWQGVHCGQKHSDRVIALDLQSQGLVGTLSPHVGNLSFLRIFFLQNNSFHGPIPEEIGRLSRLREIDLSNNSFSGEIPNNFSRCANLYSLVLIDNKLTGKIPMELGSLLKLEALGLSKNNLLGAIPSSIGNLSQLYMASLGENGFNGRIPEEISQLLRLEFLQLSGNNLTGEIPSGIYNVSSIYYFDVRDNRLQGSIPFDIGFTLPNLNYFDVQNNSFTGRVPISLSNASQLEGIYLPYNHLTGPIPKDLGRLPRLRGIEFAYNQLQDDLSFLDSLTNCTMLEEVALAFNFFRGALPKSIANLSNNIWTFSLSFNQLNGTIPLGIENLVNLRFLELLNNNLTGPIPDVIGKFHKLEVLALDINQFTGEIPYSFDNLTELSLLSISSNNLHGSIPRSLGNCRKLLGLDLSQNNLTGSIPPEVISLSSLSISLNLAHNALSGSIPSEVGLLRNLGQLDFSDNKLSGFIPNSIGQCLSMEKLYLQDNLFNGNVPQSLSSLRGIRELDISHNNLSGAVPDYLARLPGLIHLNISFNQFKGKLPVVGVFSNSSAISVVGNSELCGGVSEIKLPSCPSPGSKLNKVSRSLKMVIVMPVVVASCLVLLLACFFIFCRRRRMLQRNNSSSPSFKYQILRVSYRELFKATNGFSEANMVGFGSYATVYKGILDQDGIPVAVKVLNLQYKRASKSFLLECNALRTTRHRNLLKLLSVCSTVDFQNNDFKALVYEYMANGSLDKWLHSNQVGGLRNLNLMERLNIAVDIASAIDYLHNGCQETIIHGDLKPSNVLLDGKMTAHVGDFGLAKIISTISEVGKQYPSSSAAVTGSIGYVASEYGMTHKVSTQGDVYSYGIILLEMFTGKSPIHDLFKGDLNLHTFVKRSLPNRVMEIVDPSILIEEDEIHRINDCVVNILGIGVACSNESPKNRMEIRQVINELQASKRIYEKVTPRAN